MTRPTAALISALTVFTVLGIALVFAQPSLTPPAGPVEASGRFGTLIELNDQTDPGDANHRHIIAQPGSYILTSDIDAVGRSGVLIATDNVTLDLNGYTIGCDCVSLKTAGVTVPPPVDADIDLKGVTVRNGRIEGFGIGVRATLSALGPNFALLTSTLTNLRLDDLDVQCLDRGIAVVEARVTDCSIVATNFPVLADRSIFEGCEITLTESSTAGSLALNLRESVARGCLVDTRDSVGGPTV